MVERLHYKGGDKMIKTILGIFTDQKDADHAVDDLHDAGFNPKDVSIVMKNQAGGYHVRDDGSVVTDSTISGAATGGIIGGIAGLLIGMGAIAVPGIGALLIGGPLAAAFGLTGAAATTVSGAATGVLAGGLLGALVGLGVPEDEARVYEEKIRAGGVLVAVSAAADAAPDARAILEDNNAEQIKVLAVDTPVEETADDYRPEYGRHYATYGVKGGKAKVRGSTTRTEVEEDE